MARVAFRNRVTDELLMVLLLLHFELQICMAARRDTLVLPCAHLLYCHTCLAAASEARLSRKQQRVLR